jgi:hypothetical protein
MNLKPVFAGRDAANNLYILYQEEVDDLQYIPRDQVSKEIKPAEEYHLRLPDGEMHALAPGSQLFTWEDPDRHFMHLKIVSGVWTGELNGSRLDLIEAKIIDRNRDNV